MRARATEVTPTVLVTELDAHIHQRMAAQPATIEDVEARYAARTTALSPRHRLALPEFFESQSMDCTWGQGCTAHANGARGRYCFRWIFKRKQAVDRAIDEVGWTLVNHAYFPTAPRLHFTANGGVELGDSILAFIPAKQALEMRAAPAKRSQEHLGNRMTDMSTEDEQYVLMTGNPADKRFYKPDMPPEAVERDGVSPAGVMVEGKDFNQEGE